MAYPSDARPITVELYVDGDWVDVTSYVAQRQSCSIQRGSGSENNSTPPTTMSLLLLNTDGRFTRENPTSPYYPFLRQSTQIRYSIEDGGTTYYRFVGEVSEWPVTIDQTSDDNTVRVEAAGIFRRWERQLPLESPLRRAYVASDTVVAYWPMEDDGANAQTLASGLTGKPAMLIKQAIDVAAFDGFVGSGPVPDIGTGQVFGPIAPHVSTGFYVYQFSFNTSAVGATDTTIGSITFSAGGGTSVSRVSILADTNGDLRLRFYDQAGAIISTTAYAGTFSVNDRSVLVVLDLTNNGSSLNYTLQVWYEDTLNTNVTTSGSVASRNVTTAVGVVHGLFNNLNSAVGHVGVFTGGSTNVDDITSAVYAYETERAADRYTRTCRENGVAHRLIGDAALTPRMGAQPIGTIKNILDECVEVDHSLMFESRDEFGVTFLTRNALYNQRDDVKLSPDIPFFASGSTTLGTFDSDYASYIYPGAQFKIYVIATGNLFDTQLFTFDEVQNYGSFMAATWSPAATGSVTTAHEIAIFRSGLLALNYDDHELLPPTTPRHDDRLTTNEVTVKRDAGSEYTATESIGIRSTQDPPNGIGRYAITTTINLYTDGELAEHATWLLNLGLNDDARWAAAEVGLHSLHMSSRQADVLSLDVGHRVTIDGMSNVHVYDTQHQLTRGYTETFDGNRLHYLTLNCIPERLYHVLEFDNTELDCRWAATNTTLAETMTTTVTGGVDVSTGSTIWTTSAGNFPLDVTIGGERVTLSSITGAGPGSISLIGVGTTDTDTTNNALTPGLPASAASGDVVFIFVTAGTAGNFSSGSSMAGGTISTPTNWNSVINLSDGFGGGNMLKLFWRVYDGVWTMPSITNTAGAAGVNWMAQTAAFRNVNASGIVVGGYRLLLGGVNPEDSDIPTNWSLDSVVGQRGVTLLTGWKLTSWASVTPPADFTEIGELDTTTAVDAGQTWAYQVGNAAAGSATFDIITPLDDVAWTRMLVIFIPATPQEFVISARSVNGVVKAHVAGEPIDVANPFYYGL